MKRFAHLILLGASTLAAQQGPPRQSEGDAYTRYELLAPGSAKFRILYEVTATTPGAPYYFNPIRLGSIATDESVFDRATGKPLQFDEVGVDIARQFGVRSPDTSQKYIRVKLTRPVPENGGEARIEIDKTYEDAKSYYMEGNVLVFNRPLGIKRNSVFLPKGYELVSSNVPSQILQLPDGRVGVSFWNNTQPEAPLILRAKPASFAGGTSAVASRLDERAHQNRKIVYFLQQPETHSFDLYHDYTESKPGTSTYINIVREGSTVSKPSARNLDTGEELTYQIDMGDEITRAKLDVPNVTAKTEAVVFKFPAVQHGQSIRLRMYETYTDTARYKIVGDEFVWDRSFGRPANAIVLPDGWVLANSSIPATVSQQPDGRIRLDFINPRPDEIAVLVTAKRRAK